jgi:hypothetical protein
VREVRESKTKQPSGPLKEEVGAAMTRMEGPEYSDDARYRYGRVLRLLDEYLAERRARVDDQLPRHVEQFLPEVRRRHRRARRPEPISYCWPRALDLLLEDMRARGRLPQVPSPRKEDLSAVMAKLERLGYSDHSRYHYGRALTNRRLRGEVGMSTHVVAVAAA